MLQDIINFMPQVFEGLKTTLLVFTLTLILSIPLGVIIALGRISKIKVLNSITGIYIYIFRGTPLLLQILFIFFGLPLFGISLDRLPAAILAMVLNYGAYFGEIFRAGINSIDKGQVEAAEVIGMSKRDTFFRIILPQALKSEEEMEIIEKNTIDFLGVNYYQPRRIKSKESEFDNSNGWMPDKHFDYYDMPNKRMNIYRGWEIYPQAMYDIAINIRDNYNNIPWYISENGMGVEGEEKYRDENGIIQDDYRIEFYEEHLQYLNKGIVEGSNCFGYHSWTPIDCWSWSNAYKNRYGFIAVDLKTQEKIIKKSGRWIKSVSQNNGV